MDCDAQARSSGHYHRRDCGRGGRNAPLDATLQFPITGRQVPVHLPVCERAILQTAFSLIRTDYPDD